MLLQKRFFRIDQTGHGLIRLQNNLFNKIFIEERRTNKGYVLTHNHSWN